ncbi:MAG: hypothetical protein J6580_07935 [Gilliamella sp.]|uniref:hypothetical protein n=1 Tax=Gilliamella sp. TaxID=1891236 RepID=UPI0025CE4344|nr:hypothetical protein [Gilliamella sp.]MCO6550597.1 hypothetical protein [Gilliamella sp.]
MLGLLLLSSSWNLQALTSKSGRVNNHRSDAIILSSTVLIDYVRPNLMKADSQLPASPVDIWNPHKGFLVQSIDPESYNLNFPTTGAHNLYFDLLITGIDVNELTWLPVTHEGITATVTNVVANDRWIPDEDKGKVFPRVKLTGPVAGNQWDNPNPSRITVPKLPQKFELVGKDSDGNEVVRYGFELRQWFVNRGDRRDTASNQTTWCSSLGYRMPQIKDLTNAVCVDHNPYSSDPSYSKCKNAVTIDAKLSSGNRFYQRRIGAGFFTEWGIIDTFFIPDAGFVGSAYLTSIPCSEEKNGFLAVHMGGGDLGMCGKDDDVATLRDHVICSTP